MGTRATWATSAIFLASAMLGVVGCQNNPPDSSSSNGHQMGYTDAPPKDTGPGAPGMQTTNDPSNPLPPGGLTVPPPARVTPDESGSSNSTK